ncbi:MAG TPA: tyrosine--tRNA ligase [Polyangia bacterium]
MDVFDVLKARGFVKQVVDEAALRAHFAAGPVTYYCGFDPTAPSLHIGSLVPLMAMAHLAKAGHRPIGVLGGGTSMVGDPSGRTELRQMMTPETIAKNRQGIDPQVRRFVELGGPMGTQAGATSSAASASATSSAPSATSSAPGAAGNNARIVDNAEWLLQLNYIEFLRDIGKHFSVNRMLAAEAYKIRLEKGLSFIEFNYQILQAYDYLVLFQRYGCTLQIGGDDQWGNILAGADLIRRLHQKEVHALTFPLIQTASGAKMGKTAAGAIWMSPELTSVFDFFQYFLNVDDRDVERFLKLYTFLPLDEVARLAALTGANIREAKRVLAFEVTKNVHGEKAANTADRAARAAFGGGAEGGADVPTHALSAGEADAGMKVVDLLAAAGLAVSKSAARRLVEQGGVRLGDRKVDSVDAVVGRADLGAEGVLLHAGKKHLRRIVVRS